MWNGTVTVTLFPRRTLVYRVTIQKLLSVLQCRVLGSLCLFPPRKPSFPLDGGDGTRASQSWALAVCPWLCVFCLCCVGSYFI